MFRSFGNVIAAGILFVLAATMFIATFGFPPPGQDFDPGSAAFPRILLASLGTLAVFMLFDSGETGALPRGRAATRVAGTVALMLAYALVFEKLGFLVSTILVLVALVFMSGTRSLVALALLPVGVSFALFYVFNQLLSVSLPTGPIEGILF